MAGSKRTRTVVMALVAVAALVGLAGVFLLRSRPARAPGVASAPSVYGGRPRLALPSAPPDGVVSGRVLGPDGAGVAGAAVTARRRPDPKERFSREMSPPSARSDRDGGFRIEGLAPGSYTLAAIASGFPGVARPGVEVAGRPVEGIELRLVAGGFQLTGRVIDAGGGTIAGAQVSVDGANRGGLFLAESDTAGSYRLRLLPGRYFIRVSAGGYTEGHAFLDLGADATHDFRLEPGAHIDGRVVLGDSGQPVAGARVVAHPLEVGLRSDYGPATTDGAGAFHIDGLPPGSYRLAAARQPLSGTLAQPIELLSAGAASGVVITVSPGFAVSGTVKSAAGAPVAGAELNLLPDEQALMWLLPVHGSSDGQGRYRFEGIPAGEHTIRAEAAGHGAISEALVVSGPVSHDVVLGQIAAVSALVLDTAGRPAAGVAVRAMTMPAQPGQAGGDFDEAITDAQGRCTFKRLRGGLVTLDATSRSGDLGSAGPEAISPDTPKQLTIRLTRGARISGTVAWEDGKPAANAEVQAQPDGLGGSPARATSGPGGEFTVGPLAPGRILLHLQAPGELFGLEDGLENRMFTLAAGEQRTGVKLVVHRRTGSLRGVVVGPDRQPMAGVVVKAGSDGDHWILVVDDGERGRAVTAGDGSFALDDLPRGALTVVVKHPGYPTLVRSGVAAGTRDLRLRLQRPATLDGVLVDARGAPVPRYSVQPSLAAVEGDSTATAAMANQRQAIDVNDRSGAFHVGGLPPGLYQVAAFTEDGRVAYVTDVDLAEGQHRRGLRLVAGDEIAIPGGMKRGGMRAVMIGASKEAENSKEPEKK